MNCQCDASLNTPCFKFFCNIPKQKCGETTVYLYLKYLFTIENASKLKIITLKELKSVSTIKITKSLEVSQILLKYLTDLVKVGLYTCWPSFKNKN